MATFTRMWFVRLSLLASGLMMVCSVDKGNFKTCDQSGFCKRQRAMEPGVSPYRALLSTVDTTSTSFSMEVINVRNDVKFKMELIHLKGNMARLRITEREPLVPRYEPPIGDVLLEEPAQEHMEVQAKSDEVVVTFGENKVIIQAEPFRLDFIVEEEVVTSVNAQGLMKFEHTRKKEGAEEVKPDEGEDVVGGEPDEHPEADKPDDPEEPDMWEETFKTHKDSKVNGPQSVGMDFSFPGFEHVYGIPEHADHLALRSTKNTDPYRLYNLDVFEYEIHSTMALYGSIPLMIAHNAKKTVGLFWLNAAETWVDVSSNTADKNVMSKLVDFVKGGDDMPQIDTHWFSESGIIDVFFLLGPKPADVFLQYAALTGTTPLPPLFALSYHQCRWNYNDEQDVAGVDAGFDKYDIPMDVIWLDIEHTDGKRYFTWDAHRFPHSADMINKLAAKGRKMVAVVDPHLKRDSNFRVYQRALDEGHLVSNKDGQTYDGWCWPGREYFTWDSLKFPDSKQMINDVAAKGRKMVTIVDPHIKRDDNYKIHKLSQDRGVYVKNNNGGDYEGWCWPGSSSWIDFTDPKGREFWASMFDLQEYDGSTSDLHIWNDMNEPSVFNGPEITMHKDAKHYGDWEHRDVHNIYGMYVHRATYEGLLQRSGGNERPFVLSRAIYAGSQRYGAIWTGDNTGEWSHLKISIPMVLSLNLAGVTFSGADVGGFFKNPDAELLTRWYQAGAFQPFFRAHAHHDTRRREPWLMPEDNLQVISEAVRTRYTYLPYWYTLFYQGEKRGMPVMRPLWVEFPSDPTCFSIDDEHMVGNGLLVKPVTDSLATSITVKLPGPDELWYDVVSYRQLTGGQMYYMPVNLGTIPVFQRGGTIIPRKMRRRRSSSLTYNDPYTLVVALDKNGHAVGQLYIDDFHTFRYQDGFFAFREFTYENNELTNRNADSRGIYDTDVWLERVIVLGVEKEPSTITLRHSGGRSTLDFKYESSTKVLTIRRPAMKIVDKWVISVE